MKLTIFNGSPRAKSSNSKILSDSFISGFSASSNENPEVFFLSETEKFLEYKEAFCKSDMILFIFPLYVDAMPGIVKLFFEILENTNTENKKIGNYSCYKAITNKKTKNNNSIPIIAWYCPELAYQFGPNGYGNLPGLIVELQIDNVIYGLKSINFDDKTIKFKEIDFKKIISLDKYDEIIKEKMKFVLDE